MDPAYNQLDQLVNSLKCWNCKLLLNTADDPNIMCNEIYLCEVMNSTHNYCFPERFDGLQNKSKLITELKLVAMKSGFTLCQLSAKSQKQLKYELGAYITLVCQHDMGLQSPSK